MEAIITSELKHSPAAVIKAILVTHIPSHERMEKAKQIVADEDPKNIERITDILYRKGMLQRRMSDRQITITSRGEQFVKDTEYDANNVAG